MTFITNRGAGKRDRFLAAVRQLGQLALIGLLFRQLTSKLFEYSPQYPHLIFGIPRRIKIVSRNFLIPTSKLASILAY